MHARSQSRFLTHQPYPPAPAATCPRRHSRPTMTNGPASTSTRALNHAKPFPKGERTDEDEMSWYARELGQFVALASPCTPSGSGAHPRAELLFLLPPSYVSCEGPRSRMSKPLPAVPRVSGPNPQLDPTFPRRRPPVPGTTTTTPCASRLRSLFRAHRHTPRSHLTSRSTTATHGPSSCPPIPAPAPAPAPRRLALNSPHHGYQNRR